MNFITKIKNILLNEGLINYTKRKLNISYLDSKTVFKIDYKNRKTKIILNRKFGHVDMMIFKNGIYEKHIIDDMYNELSTDKNFIDIGSNIGQHSLLLAPYCKHVYAFEPLLPVYEQFKKSAELNHYKNVTIFNTAIGSKEGSKSFNFVTNHAGTSSFVERDNPNQNVIEVKISSLQNTLKDVKMDVVKIDVEGYEAVVIMGNKEKFLKDRPIIFTEFNPTWIEKEGSYNILEVYRLFKNNNFSIYSRNDNKFITTEKELNIRNQDNWIVKPL